MDWVHSPPGHAWWDDDGDDGDVDPVQELMNTYTTPSSQPFDLAPESMMPMDWNTVAAAGLRGEAKEGSYGAGAGSGDSVELADSDEPPKPPKSTASTESTECPSAKRQRWQSASGVEVDSDSASAQRRGGDPHLFPVSSDPVPSDPASSNRVEGTSTEATAPMLTSTSEQRVSTPSTVCCMSPVQQTGQMEDGGGASVTAPRTNPMPPPPPPSRGPPPPGYTDEERKIDSKLWPGAGEAGWTLKECTQGHYKYFSPDGRRFTSKKAAKEEAGVMGRARKATSEKGTSDKGTSEKGTSEKGREERIVDLIMNEAILYDPNTGHQVFLGRIGVATPDWLRKFVDTKKTKSLGPANDKEAHDEFVALGRFLARPDLKTVGGLHDLTDFFEWFATMMMSDDKRNLMKFMTDSERQRVPTLVARILAFASYSNADLANPTVAQALPKLEVLTLLKKKISVEEDAAPAGAPKPREYLGLSDILGQKAPYGGPLKIKPADLTKAQVDEILAELERLKQEVSKQVEERSAASVLVAPGASDKLPGASGKLHGVAFKVTSRKNARPGMDWAIFMDGLEENENGAIRSNAALARAFPAFYGREEPKKPKKCHKKQLLSSPAEVQRAITRMEGFHLENPSPNQPTYVNDKGEVVSVDTKLWKGAAAAGWGILNKRNGHYCYVTPILNGFQRYFKGWTEARQFWSAYETEKTRLESGASTSTESGASTSTDGGNNDSLQQLYDACRDDAMFQTLLPSRSPQ